ncbi:hypothetical protein HAX54_033404, partial [Datura stramonium]|nr:hypothetical protein [Datura stramonium]
NLPEEVLQQSKASIVKIVSKMLSIKNEEILKSQLSEVFTQIYINFVSLCQANANEIAKLMNENEQLKAITMDLRAFNIKRERKEFNKSMKLKKRTSQTPDGTGQRPTRRKSPLR